MARSAVDKYAVDVKESYRNTVWQVMLFGFNKKQLKGKNAVILSGPEGREVPVLRRLGFEDKNIVLVDSSPANVATAKRVNGADESKAYGCKLDVAMKRMVTDGVKVSFINADFCGNLSGDVFEQIERMMKSPAMANRVRVCITFQKGREPAVFRMLLKGMKLESRNDLVGHIIQNAGFSYRLIGSGDYRNNTTPMSWVVYDVIRVTAIKQMYGAMFYDGGETSRRRGKIGVVHKAIQKITGFTGDDFDEYDIISDISKEIMRLGSPLTSDFKEVNPKLFKFTHERLKFYAGQWRAYQRAYAASVLFMDQNGMGIMHAQTVRSRAWSNVPSYMETAGRPYVLEQCYDIEYYMGKSRGHKVTGLVSAIEHYADLITGKVSFDETHPYVRWMTMNLIRYSFSDEFNRCQDVGFYDTAKKMASYPYRQAIYDNRDPIRRDIEEVEGYVPVDRKSDAQVIADSLDGCLLDWDDPVLANYTTDYCLRNNLDWYLPRLITKEVGRVGSLPALPLSE